MGMKARSKGTTKPRVATTARKTRRPVTAAKSTRPPTRSASRSPSRSPAAERGQRTFQALLECGGEADCAEELATLLSMSVDVLRAMGDKRAATRLLATPARMRLPTRRAAHRAGGDGDGAPDAG